MQKVILPFLSGFLAALFFREATLALLHTADLIAATGFNAYPPRLPEQPIFYPVLNERYAREICDKWNRRRADAQYTGYVTTFEIDDDYAARFPVQTVGAGYHQELWVPAEELEEFNRHIVGKIRIIP